MWRSTWLMWSHGLTAKDAVDRFVRELCASRNETRPWVWIEGTLGEFSIVGGETRWRIRQDASWWIVEWFKS